MIDITPLKEIKFLLILGLAFMGWQASLSLIYKYYKMRDDNVKLNRILLAYGFLTFCGMFSMLFITIITLFITDVQLADILRMLFYIFALTALMMFWHYISVEQLSKILKSKITRTFSLITIIPIILVIILGTRSSEFRFSLIIIVIEAIFVIFFQVRLILSSSGTLRKRFILIFFTGICAAISMILGSNSALGNPLQFPKDLYDITFFLGAIFMFAALLFLYISIYNFPPILEFKWKENLLKIVIFNQKDYSTLFFYDFPDKGGKSKIKTEDLEEEESASLFSGGLFGINSIISAITNTEGEQISKIKQGNSFILLDYGLKYEQIPITYAIIVRENLKSIRYFLSNIKQQFESFYKEILLNFNDIKKGSVELLFGSFEVIVNNLLEVK